MKKQYTVDEIVNKRYAVMLDREDETNKIDVALKDIPVRVKEGDIVNIEFEGEKIIFAEVDVETTKRAREEVQKLLDELKSKGSKDLKW
ncbi:MAG: DUF3006 domain-containing protein [Candidatus Humimicrobiaceae bacterium]